MDAASLIELGMRSARDCLMLIDINNRPESVSRHVGYWGGELQSSLHSNEWKHWLSISTSEIKIRELPQSNILTVFERRSAHSANDEDNFMAAVLPRTPLSELRCTGRPLCAIAGISYPSIDALLASNDPAIGRWLDHESPRRHSVASIARHMRATDAGSVYEEWFNTWLHTQIDTYVGVMGGWHLMWPEDKAYDRPNERLAIWIFKDAYGDPEPQLEVWIRDTGDIHLMPRIT